MTDKEKSILLYLLDAIRADQTKVKDYFKIVTKKSMSEQYKNALEKLKNNKDILATAAKIRESLR